MGEGVFFIQALKEPLQVFYWRALFDADKYSKAALLRVPLTLFIY